MPSEQFQVNQCSEWMNCALLFFFLHSGALQHEDTLCMSGNQIIKYSSCKTLTLQLVYQVYLQKYETESLICTNKQCSIYLDCKFSVKLWSAARFGLLTLKHGSKDQGQVSVFTISIIIKLCPHAKVSRLPSFPCICTK